MSSPELDGFGKTTDMYGESMIDEEEEIYISGAMKRKQSPLKRDSLASRYR